MPPDSVNSAGGSITYVTTLLPVNIVEPTALTDLNYKLPGSDFFKETLINSLIGVQGVGGAGVRWTPLLHSSTDRAGRRDKPHAETLPGSFKLQNAIYSAIP